MSVTTRAATHEQRPADGTIESVNVGRSQTLGVRGVLVRTAIWKDPVAGPVAVRGVNLAGDAQADRSVHGGPDKAVYAYAVEDLEWWSVRLGWELGAGTVGENLTVSGMDLTAAVIGERWAVGSVVLEVAQPRVPCYKLGIRMGDPLFPRRFAAAARPGAYLRIVREGELQAGDSIRILQRPDHGVTIGLVDRAYLADHSLGSQLLEAPQLPRPLLAWARHRLGRVD
jgi:MOSC domain-containing protein YiiM